MISIGWMFFWAIFWTIVGFITTKIFGFDIPKLVSDLIIFFLLFFPVLFFQDYGNLEKAISLIERIITTFIEMAPGLVVGDIVGSIFAAITGQRVE